MAIRDDSRPPILLRLREGFTTRNEGPHRANEAVERYLSKEKQLGRVGQGMDPRAAADLLLGSCFQHAFQLNFLGKQESQEERMQYANRLLDMLLQ
ncbi:TetR/AcrR family transcriptional regulator C-terminal domain-containing protein [Cohnella nanjingensis]|uniref:TetR/AcrR family transcriptional regulator C-terminal domain-containing protein n=1 Tax=Cohnella nanjingensis TaxID=1387779 RepID=A0A7X0VEF5_9BACL|nr:TetR/AcrR family transcriptional regulator C-terminal domain-containing protein [Cohnella nanjingensis]MBB6670223.1 TetR/AcrR family transcriptional regulator C-terminal domain-containing protein [Cohnella nanjingensis]